MKKILVEYYSRKNLGDDLFIHVLSEYFSDCKIYLLGNPLKCSNCYNHNVKKHIFSYLLVLLDKLSSITKSTKFCNLLYLFRNYIIKYLKYKFDAYVKIGGSIFMSKSDRNHEIDFSTNTSPIYNNDVIFNNTEPSFIIGANLGPAFTEDYFKNIEILFNHYKHITLRDYSSYVKMKHLKHVQYAPDVLFGLKVPELSTNGGVVISVIDISRHTTDNCIIDAYYTQIIKIIDYFNNKNIKISLISFCKKEGDEIAIERILQYINNKANIEIISYDGNYNIIIEVFSQSCFVVGSRFHSIILGIHFNKPVLPICYNCKTTNYLLDLDFKGISINLKNISEQTLDSLLYNYTNNYICDCREHQLNSKNQFSGLKTYLDII